MIRRLSAACRDPSMESGYILKSAFEGFEMDSGLLSSAGCSKGIHGSGDVVHFRGRNVFPIWVLLAVLVGSMERVLSGALMDGKNLPLWIGTTRINVQVVLA